MQIAYALIYSPFQSQRKVSMANCWVKFSQRLLASEVDPCSLINFISNQGNSSISKCLTPVSSSMLVSNSAGKSNVLRHSTTASALALTQILSLLLHAQSATSNAISLLMTQLRLHFWDRSALALQTLSRTEFTSLPWL